MTSPSDDLETSEHFNTRLLPTERFLAQHPQPVIMNFQPKTFAILESPEDLRRWEAMLVERVGLTGTVGKRIAEETLSNGGTCCESGNTNDCDVD